MRDGLAGGPQPPRLLELWTFAASPYCRKVREELAELGLGDVAHNVAKRGRRRPVLIALIVALCSAEFVWPRNSPSLPPAASFVLLLALRQTVREELARIPDPRRRRRVGTASRPAEPERARIPLPDRVERPARRPDIDVAVDDDRRGSVAP